MNLNLEFHTLKYKHINDKYFALYEMTKEMWAVVVYDENEEDILFSCIELSYNAALHKYNQIKNGDFLESLY